MKKPPSYYNIYICRYMQNVTISLKITLHKTPKSILIYEFPNSSKGPKTECTQSDCSKARPCTDPNGTVVTALHHMLLQKIYAYSLIDRASLRIRMLSLLP
jgi:hypothetical protein